MRLIISNFVLQRAGSKFHAAKLLRRLVQDFARRTGVLNVAGGYMICTTDDRLNAKIFEVYFDASTWTGF